MLRFVSAAALAAWVAGGTACGGEEKRCVELDLECTPAYPPTFDDIYDNTIMMRCGRTDGICHNAMSRAGGMSFATADEAYDALLDGRVEPGDPACSEVVRRIESDSLSFNMPLGDDVLEPDVKCAIERWIADGAER